MFGAQSVIVYLLPGAFPVFDFYYGISLCGQIRDFFHYSLALPAVCETFCGFAENFGKRVSVRPAPRGFVHAARLCRLCHSRADFPYYVAYRGRRGLFPRAFNFRVYPLSGGFKRFLAGFFRGIFPGLPALRLFFKRVFYGGGHVYAELFRR